jgi:hypothetical protein
MTDSVIELLEEVRNQLEYMDERSPSGTTPAVLVRVNAMIAELVEPVSSDRKRRAIPITAAKRIAKDYGWDQVIIYARRCDDKNGEHITTYGINREHCSAAAKIGAWLKKVAGWPEEKKGG